MVSPPAVIVEAVLAGDLLLVSSPPLLSELERVLAYPKLTRVVPDPAGITSRLRGVAELVQPAFALAVVTDEPGQPGSRGGGRGPGPGGGDR